jgi:hypothetical protein
MLSLSNILTLYIGVNKLAVRDMLSEIEQENKKKEKRTLRMYSIFILF